MVNNSDSLYQVETLAQINAVSDLHRLEILRHLMTNPGTVSQIGRLLDEYPAAVRYHIHKLIDAGLVELVEVRKSPGFEEKYYAAKSNAISIHKTILPLIDKKSIVFMGSHDLAWEKITKNFCKRYTQVKIFNFPIGSLDGLIALRQGTCQMAGSHLLDFETNQYNLPYIKHLFPGRPVQLVRLASRVQGLLFAQGNPKGIQSLNDIARSDIRFANRNPGSGTRIWLDNRLKIDQIRSHEINGYAKELNSHSAVAQEITLGHADLGLGLIAAGENRNLDSIPLFEEQFDLVLPGSGNGDGEISNVLDYLSSQGTRHTIDNLPGYDALNTGTCIEV